MSSDIQSVLHPGGPDAAIIAQFAWVLFAGGALIYCAVMLLTMWSLRHGRQRELKPLHWILGAGVAFPVTVLSALLVWSTWRSGQLSAQHSRQPLQVSIVAKMWWWEVRYPNPSGGPDIVAANEIHIPAGQPVWLGITSADVIHSVWVPALNGKMDAIPGRVTGLTLHAAKPGVYRGQCAEFCGEQHARMALHVIAHEASQYAAWMAREARPAAAPADTMLEQGQRAFLTHGCVSCHTIRGVGGDTRLGPDLTHIGSRMHIAAGTLRNHRGTLGGWIADPQSIKPGVRMPAASGMDGPTMRALAAYLESLK